MGNMSPLQRYATNSKSRYPSFQDSQPFPLARMFKHTSTLTNLGYLNMPWNWSEAVPEGNGPIPQKEEFGLANPRRRTHTYRVFEERFERQRKGNKRLLDKMDGLSHKMDELSQEMRATN